MTDPDVVIVVGAEAVHAGIAPVVRDVAERTNIGILNTWCAKGLFPWNHPAHLATIGLQADDVALAGLSGFDEVILCGVSDDELDRSALTAGGVNWRDVVPSDLAAERLPVRAEPTPRPALYERLAAECQRMYADESVPLNPARAASDLAASLPDNGVVCADASKAGFWIGRTFPTRTVGSVQLPTRAIRGFAATQASIARRIGRFSVAVVDGIDDATQAMISRAPDLVVEVWSTDGEPLDSSSRVQRLRNAHNAGGVHVLSLAIRFDEIRALEAVAGAPRWHP